MEVCPSAQKDKLLRPTVKKKSVELFPRDIGDSMFSYSFTEDLANILKWPILITLNCNSGSRLVQSRDNGW